tara:strand:+ start:1380 stop:2474 length:1095 start_codon:yes stop_codon:yes gene_type:complete
MTDLLDDTNNSLQEAEEQLLQEFSRIRNSLPETRYEPIDAGIKIALGEIVLGLHAKLELSANKNNLQRQTDQLEVLFTRISVIQQLLEAKISTAYLQEVHQDVASSRKQLERKVVARRSSEESNALDEPTKQGRFFKSLKNIFSAAKSDGEQQELEDIEVYLDKGIYSASRALAMLASRVSETTDVEDEPTNKKKIATPARPRGRAQFSSRDLSGQKAEALPDIQTASQAAQTPEEIHRKLESSRATSSVTSTFEAKDLSHAMPTPKPIAESKQIIEKDTSHGEIARTPEAIRQKLAERQQTSSGKASFISKDIEPEVPHEPFQKPKEPQEPKEPKEPKPPAPRPTGKAVFESRELSKPDPRKK